MEQDEKELMDLVGSIRNRCDIVMILFNTGASELAPTVLEDLAEDAQMIVLEYLKKEERKDE